ncbi:MAG: hypothetical protein P4M08_11360 [Oligoflexia bacterium]|nr:hypothetical protein [Oligoflexia bacterium]
MNPQSARIAFALMFLTAGCASAPTAVTKCPTDPAVQKAGSETSIEVSYFLGHSRRRFLLSAHDSQILGESYVDRALLKKVTVDPAHFQSYLAKISDYVDQKRNLASAPTTQAERECRAPFKIALQQPGHELRTVEGCRQDEPSSFNRLVDEGEFLIYSSK